MTDINKTDITLIIDTSGSMQTLKGTTIEGVNKFVNDQLKAAADAKTQVRFDLVKFDDNVNRLPGIALTSDNYRPENGGMTALYDAIGKTVTEAGARLAALPESARPSKVIVLIVTDGGENASRDYTYDRVRKLIREQTDKYSWDFVFLGANQDAWSIGTSLGVAPQKAMTFVANLAGTQSAFASASSYATRAVQSKTQDDYLKNSFNAADVSLQSAAGLDTSNLVVPDALNQ